MAPHSFVVWCSSGRSLAPVKSVRGLCAEPHWIRSLRLQANRPYLPGDIERTLEAELN